MNRTKIEYLDVTWNPIVGCDGHGCAVRDNCWARAQARRQKHRCTFCYDFIPHIHKERFLEPLKRRKPARIGVCFMGDVFDSSIVSHAWSPILDTIEKAPQHTFIVFTKQPQNVPLHRESYPPNLWLVVSVNRTADLWRIDELRKKNVKIKGVSFEPLYEDIASQCEHDMLNGIHWIIIGAQTRPSLCPDPQWVKNLIRLSSAAGNNIAVFLKDNLNWPVKIQEFPEEALDETRKPGRSQVDA